MSRLRRYEVALEAEEEIYWGCFYFFPWLRMWRRERSPMSPTSQRLSLEPPRLPLTSWHPWNKTKQKQEALPLPSSTSCCTQLYRQPLPNRLLRRIVRVELQEADGDCHLQAVVLHLARRSVCVHPQNRSLARWLERQGKRLQGTIPSLNPVLQKKMYSSPQQQN
ncbi:C-C motif chemokine 27 isoform X1 [Mastomys coucha]|uniref:C-C motif chemokine 27 isoform X1 n=1 Tax=Mastomys coucha TaxID=35658 RepID=UPI001262584C|nr:C-C motif chemokine 27 isoform X1 [Mastomys coucha]XP_031232984.1 C-C motif chemokine 27 isoform X1 [Mastomys coucha]